jgi:hypothetical protein
MRKNSEVAERIRQTAYFLWDQDGRPEERSFHYWLKAKEMLLRELAYDKWLADGAPIGRAEKHWREAAREIGDK